MFLLLLVNRCIRTSGMEDLQQRCKCVHNPILCPLSNLLSYNDKSLTDHKPLQFGQPLLSNLHESSVWMMLKLLTCMNSLTAVPHTLPYRETHLHIRPVNLKLPILRRVEGSMLWLARNGISCVNVTENTDRGGQHCNR